MACLHEGRHHGPSLAADRGAINDSACRGGQGETTPGDGSIMCTVVGLARNLLAFCAANADFRSRRRCRASWRERASAPVAWPEKGGQDESTSRIGGSESVARPHSPVGAGPATASLAVPRGRSGGMRQPQCLPQRRLRQVYRGLCHVSVVQAPWRLSRATLPLVLLSCPAGAVRVPVQALRLLDVRAAGVCVLPADVLRLRLHLFTRALAETPQSERAARLGLAYALTP